MPRRLSCVFLLGLLCTVTIPLAISAEMMLADSPMFIVIDQTFRLIVNSPPLAETVTVKTPPGIEMFDSRVPEKDPSTGLFYFRALKTGEMTIRFSSGGSSLDVPVTVLSWEDVLKQRNYHGLELPRIWPVGTADITLKQQRNILTDADLAALRKPGSKPSDEAQRLTLEDIYSSLTGSHVPRNVFVNKAWGKNMTRMGCPVCGLAIYEGRSPFYPWLIDSEKHPYQLGCPNCGNWFPSNDYTGGDMHSGEFVDDGYGVDFDGYRMGFVGYYSLWYYIRYYLPMVNRLANDYARTGDPETARKAAVALFRIAEQYLNLSINVNQRVETTMRAIWDNKYGTLPREPELFMSGLYNLNCWGTSAITQLSRVYEILFDYLHESDPELLAFVRSKNHSSITTMEEYRRFVETGFFRTVTQSFMDLSKVGNLPEGSRALVNFSLFMGTPETRDIIDWVYDGGGEMRFFLTNHFFKDGAAYESQGYNVIHVNGFQEVIDGMNELRRRYPGRFPVSSLPLLENDPKYKQLYLFPIHFSLIDRTSPEIGDHGTVVKTEPLPLSQTSDLSAPHYLNAFRMTGDRRFAQVFSGPSGKIPAAVPDSLRKQIETIVAEDGWHIPLESEVLDGYGHTVLRSGEGDGQRAVWMRYGRSRGHIQDDMLTIGYEGFKRKLLPELGYPRSWTFRRTWEGNWATHYTGLIRGLESGAERFKGHLTLFAAGEGIQATGACAPYYLTDNGPERYTILGNNLFDRSIVSVDLTDSTGYVVDVLRMAGGTEHWWSFHSPRGTSTLAGSHTYAREGTALGAGLAYGESPPGSEGLEALSYMTNVRTGPVIGPWHLDTMLENYPEIHVRTTAVEPNYSNLILADGGPPGGGEAYSLRWALMHNEGGPGLKTRFTQIIEA